MLTQLIPYWLDIKFRILIHLKLLSLNLKLQYLCNHSIILSFIK